MKYEIFPRSLVLYSHASKKKRSVSLFICIQYTYIYYFLIIFVFLLHDNIHLWYNPPCLPSILQTNNGNLIKSYEEHDKLLIFAFFFGSPGFSHRKSVKGAKRWQKKLKKREHEIRGGGFSGLIPKFCIGCHWHFPST